MLSYVQSPKSARQKAGHSFKRAVLYLFPALLLSLLFACQPESGTRPNRRKDLEEKNLLLDTMVSIRLYNSRGEAALKKAFKQMEEWENQLSRHIPGSEISAVNSSPAGVPVQVSPETLELVELALNYAGKSQGKFDPTIGPLVDLWGIGGEFPEVPDEELIKQTLQSVNYKNVQTDSQAATITLTQPDMSLDLGGIAKGWIADQIAADLRESGEKHILINLGGNVLVSGGKPGGKPFRIGMQNPFDERGSYLGVFSVYNRSIVSSGIYERYFEQDGIRYHHILDSSSGYPVNNSLAAVTVLSSNSADGDALSTTLFALGLEDGLDFAYSLPGVEAAFITREGRIVMTSGCAEIFEPIGDVSFEVRKP